jgi:transcriptional regulator with XRE-family HTH domain
MHPTYVSELERGHRNPTVAVLGRLATALRTPLSTLIANAEAHTRVELRER